MSLPEDTSFDFYRKKCLCCILTLDRAVNQRWTCVNKRKKQKQVNVMKEYRQVPAGVKLVGHRKAREWASLQTEGCGPQRPPVEQSQPRYRRSAKLVLEVNTAYYGQEKKLGQYEQSQPRYRRSAKLVLEINTAYYGQEKKLGQYSSLSLSPPISHTPQKYQPFRE